MQEPNFPLGTPAKVPIFTSQTLRLKLRKLPPKARRAFRVKDAPHNLVSVAELCDAGCGVYIHETGFEIEYNGEILYRGWRDADTNSRLWKMSLTDADDSRRVIPMSEPGLSNPSNCLIMATIHWSVNSIYECNNKEQLIKYYHSSLGSHPKPTLAFAAKSGYLQGCPGLKADAINKFIAIEDATELGHMRAAPAGRRSTTQQR